MLTLQKAQEIYNDHIASRSADSIIEKCFSESEFNKRKHNNVVAYYICKKKGGDLVKYDLIYQQDTYGSNFDHLICIADYIKKSANTNDIKKLRDGWKVQVSGDIYVNGLFDTISKSTVPIEPAVTRTPKQIEQDLKEAIKKLIDAPAYMYAPYVPLQIGDTLVSDDGNIMNFHFESPKVNFISIDFSIPIPENPEEASNDIRVLTEKWTSEADEDEVYVNSLFINNEGVPLNVREKNSEEIKEETIIPDVVYRETCNNRYWASEDAKWSELESWSKPIKYWSDYKPNSK